LAKEIHLAQAGLTDLPLGWEIIEVSDLLLKDRGIAVGVMYPGDHDPFGIPLIRVGDMSGSLINPRPEFRVSPAVHEEYRRTELEGGELLLTLVGGLGQCAVVPKSMRGWNAARAVAVIRLKDPSDAQFLRLCLLSQPLQYLINAWANTTVQATLNLKEIRRLPVPWPPKRERAVIANVVGALDDKIELNRRMNETLEAMARALFQNWFVDATQAGLPKGWRERTVDEDFNLTMGQSPPGESYNEPALYAMGVADHNFLRISMRPAWRLFTKSAGKLPMEFGALVEKTIDVRNAIVHGQPTGLDEKELSKLTKAVKKATEFVGTYATSIDILPELKKRYPNWIREDLSAVRIIQKSKRAFLETTTRKPADAVRDEKVERTDLSFIVDDVDSEEMAEMFSANHTAAENAQKFVKELDPFSLSMVTDVFRSEAHEAIAAEFGPESRKT